MVNISWNTPFEIEVVDAIRSAIGRETIWYTVASSIPCDICSLDPVTNTSTDSFCPQCSGFYWIPTYSGVTISGHITWGPADKLAWETGGQMFDGDCRVQIKYTPENASVVENAKWVVVDQRLMQINKINLRGVQQINRILVDLIEKEKE